MECEFDTCDIIYFAYVSNVDREIMKTKTALLIIDMQKDFLLSGRPLCVTGAMALLPSNFRSGSATGEGAQEERGVEVYLPSRRAT